MKAAAQRRFAKHTTGRRLGRLWRARARLTGKTVDWLVARGVSPTAAKVVVLAVQLAALSPLFCLALWQALTLLVVLVVAARSPEALARGLQAPDDGEWRYGYAGYGLYTSDGQRIDPHDPEDELS